MEFALEIVHIFGLVFSGDSEREEFLRMGVTLKSETRLGARVFASFEFKESHPRWNEVQESAARFQITEFFRTEFTKSECDGADALGFFASTQRGYPQPEEGMGYLACTFDLSDYCKHCGIGLRQVRPFRLKAKVELKRTVMQLNWVFDEFFVSREIWEKVFKPFGVEYWPVVVGKEESQLDSVVQLKISNHVDLKLESGSSAICQVCGRAKAEMSFRGFCPGPASIPSAIFKSTQFFGPGAAAYRRVLVSAALYKSITSHSLKVVQFYPTSSSERTAAS